METLGSKQVYANPWITVREDSIRRADGTTGIYGVVDSPNIVLIIPVDGDLLHMVEQYRYPVAGRLWEFPAGTADQRLDSEPAALAARELREETGLVAGTMTLLGTLDIMPSMLSQSMPGFRCHRPDARSAATRPGGAGHAGRLVRTCRRRAHDS